MSCSSATINEESPTTATPRAKFQNPRPVQQAIQSMTLNPSRLSRFAAESSNNKVESAAVAELKRSFTQNSIKRMAAAFTNKGRLSSMEQEESSSSSSSDEPSSSHHESTTTSPTSSSSSRDYESISSSSVDCSSLCQKQPSQLAQINKKIASSSSLLSNYSADSSRNTSSTSSNTNQVIMTFLLTAAYLWTSHVSYLYKYSDIFIQLPPSIYLYNLHNIINYPFFPFSLFPYI